MPMDKGLDADKGKMSVKWRLQIEDRLIISYIFNYMPLCCYIMNKGLTENPLNVMLVSQIPYHLIYEISLSLYQTIPFV